MNFINLMNDSSSHNGVFNGDQNKCISFLKYSNMILGNEFANIALWIVISKCNTKTQKLEYEESWYEVNL